jgi:RNA polymerase sigma factor (sigma-70 family)
MLTVYEDTAGDQVSMVEMSLVATHVPLEKDVVAGRVEQGAWRCNDSCVPATRRVLKRSDRAPYDRTDGELVQAIGVGDGSAWSELSRRYAARLASIARRWGLDASSADDVVQATWIALDKRAAHIRNPDAVRGWLAIVARNEAIRIGRLASRTTLTDFTNQDLNEQPGARSAEMIAIATMEVSALSSALAHLPSEWANLIYLRYGLGLSYPEIHERTGMPMGSIGPTIGRAREALRKVLGDENDHG